MEASRWHTWGRFVVAASAAAAISLFAFVLRSPVPIFDWVDLGIHELGHMIVMGGPRMLHFLAGSLLQVMVPAGLAVYFWWRQKDLAGAGFCAAWAGTSAWDVSVYIADAPIQALPLIGGGTHDWAYLLGPQGCDSIDQAGSIAGFVDVMGMVAAVAGIGIAIFPAFRNLRAARRPAPSESVAAADLPVRPPMAADGSIPDPLAATPDRAFPGRPELVAGDEEPAGADPWLAASQLPFYADQPGDRPPS